MTNTEKRPELDSTPIPDITKPGGLFITCSPGQWDDMLEIAYDEGWTLLEVEDRDGKEVVVRAWKRKEDTCQQ